MLSDQETIRLIRERVLQQANVGKPRRVEPGTADELAWDILGILSAGGHLAGKLCVVAGEVIQPGTYIDCGHCGAHLYTLMHAVAEGELGETTHTLMLPNGDRVATGQKMECRFCHNPFTSLRIDGTTA